MSVTIYLTDHNGRKVAFFYRIDSERYNTAPNILWACRGHEYNGVCHSKEEAFEAFKAVLKDMKQKDQSLPVRISQNNRSTCEKIPCDTCGLTSPKMEAQLTCPDCLLTDK